MTYAVGDEGPFRRNDGMNLMDICVSRNVKAVMADGAINEMETTLLHEHELSILVNERFAMKLVCTRQDLHELVLGRLLTSGFIDGLEDISKLFFGKDQNEASVFLNGKINLEEIAPEEKSCCTGNRIGYLAKGRKELKELPSPSYRPEWIFAMAQQFKKGTAIHELTYCTHSCMLARKGEILFTCEDIGRHNAIDKAIGFGLRAGIPLSECILYTSGRVPVDVVEKAITAGVPILASKTVPTAEAVELARKFGLVIIGSARADSMKVFT